MCLHALIFLMYIYYYQAVQPLHFFHPSIHFFNRLSCQGLREISAVIG